MHFFAIFFLPRFSEKLLETSAFLKQKRGDTLKGNVVCVSAFKGNVCIDFTKYDHNKTLNLIFFLNSD